MNNSFLSKLLSGILTILVLTFLLQAFFQRAIYPIYFRTMITTNIEAELETLPREVSYIDSLELIEQYTTTTHTSASLIDLNEYNKGIRAVPFIIIEDRFGEEYQIYIPRIPQALQNEDVRISGTFLQSYSGSFYVPKALYVNDRLIYGSNNTMMMSQLKYSNNFIDTETEHELSGTLVDTSIINIQDTEDVLLNRELINFSTGNITGLKQLSNGVSYTSTDLEGNAINLVYITQINIEGAEKLLLSVYPIANIDFITREMSRFNLLIYGMASLFIVITFSLFTQRISIPLRRINEATKRFANFDFGTIPEENTKDEIGTLSRNINVLSSSLKSTLTELRDKNQALSASLELESKREQTRKDFVEGVSHELKTPLAVIQATNEALSLGIIPEDDHDEHFETIKKEIHKSNKIIQDMMSVYKIDHADYRSTWEVVNFKPLIQESVDHHKVLAESKNLLIEAHLSDAMIDMDPDKIQLVVNNLLSNAIKYAPTHSKIVVRQMGGHFQIENDGDIPAESIESIFEPFYRVDKARARQEGSTGLGLYIVKQILTQHQAEYNVKSEHFKVTFEFTLN